MKDEITRRRFVKTVGAVASATLLDPSMLDLGNLWAQNATPYTRVNVNTLNKDSKIIKSYAAAIKAMKALGLDKQVSFCYQAAIHGRPAAGAAFMGPCGKGGAVMPGWNSCEHGTAWFFPWHRLYLYWFERIVRKMSGDNTWALPYWDWQTDFKLPSMFQNGGVPELNVPGRNKAMNDGTGEVFTTAEQKASAERALANKVFDPATTPNFSTLLERGAHGLVHNRLGQAPTTDGSEGLMRRVPISAEDPIFFLHHANIDRLWCKWLTMKEGRSDPLGNKAWGRDKKFTFFDENSAPQMRVSCDAVYPLMQLNYVYDDPKMQVEEKCTVQAPSCIATEDVLIYEAIESPPPPFTLPQQSDPVWFIFTPESQFRDKVLKILEDPNKTIYLNFDNVWSPTQPGVAWDVFLCPGVWPNLNESYFVGAMPLFGNGVGDEQGSHFMPASFSFFANDALQAALQNPNVKMNVTFLPSGVVVDGQQTHPAPVAPTSIGHAQLIVQTVVCS